MGEMWGGEERCGEVRGEVREVWKSVGGGEERCWGVGEVWESVLGSGRS